MRKFIEFCTRHDETGVHDPYYGGEEEEFELAIDLIEDGAAGSLAHLRGEWLVSRWEV